MKVGRRQMKTGRKGEEIRNGEEVKREKQD